VRFELGEGFLDDEQHGLSPYPVVCVDDVLESKPDCDDVQVAQ
jgi:hypothetical protein